ncbi:titin-like isoform X3 [Hemicordylus capensis]|uniref:titin-like isoform X3 n=1 Tax=Hemicordylus capensis TaxID=884348 RepID=UPI002304D0CE|nr:titin-like isoform X3 [Hemicordylus capensis]
MAARGSRSSSSMSLENTEDNPLSGEYVENEPYQFDSSSVESVTEKKKVSFSYDVMKAKDDDLTREDLNEEWQTSLNVRMLSDEAEEDLVLGERDSVASSQKESLVAPPPSRETMARPSKAIFFGTSPVQSELEEVEDAVEKVFGFYKSVFRVPSLERVESESSQDTSLGCRDSPLSFPWPYFCASNASLACSNSSEDAFLGREVLGETSIGDSTVEETALSDTELVAAISSQENRVSIPQIFEPEPQEVPSEPEMGFTGAHILTCTVCQLFVRTVDRLLDRSEELMDQFMPLTEEEIGNLKRAVQELAGTTTDQQVQSCITRISNLSSQLRQRAYMLALSKLRLARQSTHESLAQLQTTISLVKEEPPAPVEEEPPAPVEEEPPAPVEEEPPAPVEEEPPAPVEEEPPAPVEEELPAPVEEPPAPVEEEPPAPVEEEPPAPVEEEPPAPVEEEPPAPVEEEPPAPVEEEPPAPVVEEEPPAPVVEEEPPTPVVEEVPPAPVVEEEPPAPVVEEVPPAPVVVEVEAKAPPRENLCKEEMEMFPREASEEKETKKPPQREYHHRDVAHITLTSPGCDEDSFSRPLPEVRFAGSRPEVTFAGLPKDDDVPRPRMAKSRSKNWNTETMTLEMSRNLLHHLRDMYEGLMGNLKDLPASLRNKFHGTCERLGELHASFATANKFGDLPTSLLRRSLNIMSEAQDTMDDLMDYVFQNPTSLCFKEMEVAGPALVKEEEEKKEAGPAPSKEEEKEEKKKKEEEEEEEVEKEKDILRILQVYDPQGCKEDDT